MNRVALAGLLAALVATAAGCVATVPVKQVVADPGAYLDQFSRLPAEIVAKVPKDGSQMAFKRMVVEVKSVEAGTEQQATGRDVTSTWVLVNAGGGLVHSYATVKNNDVPFRINYRLSYLGVKALKWQTVFLNHQNAQLPTEVRAVKRFDSLAPGASGASEFLYTYATGEHGTLHEGRDVCSFGSSKAASDLHPSLAGKFTELTCEVYGANGQMVSRGTYAYLSQYGVGIAIGHANSTTRTAFKFTAVRVE